MNLITAKPVSKQLLAEIDVNYSFTIPEGAQTTTPSAVQKPHK